MDLDNDNKVHRCCQGNQLGRRTTRNIRGNSLWFGIVVLIIHSLFVWISLLVKRFQMSVEAFKKCLKSKQSKWRFNHLTWYLEIVIRRSSQIHRAIVSGCDGSFSSNVSIKLQRKGLSSLSSSQSETLSHFKAALIHSKPFWHANSQGLHLTFCWQRVSLKV